MTLKQYLQHLNQLVADNPEALEMDVVYSSDDEGNYYGMVNYSPTLGKYNHDDPHAFSRFDSDSETPNAVCVN